MIDKKIKEEAEKLVKLLFEEFGNPLLYSQTEDPNRSVVYVDGKEAIKWMKANKLPGWKEVEWAGFYVRHILQFQCKEKAPNDFTPIIDKKQYQVKGKYLWDIRVRSVERKPNIILNSVEIFEKLIQDNGGIGLIIPNAAMFYDTNEHAFREWQEHIKGKSSEYVLQGETVGRPPRLRKTGFIITRVFAYYLAIDAINRGLNEGWMRNDFQKGMKNADGTLRTPKYIIDLKKTPIDYLLVNKNFNSDPQEEDPSDPLDGL